MDECLRRILDAGSPALFLDYDGTLVGLRPRPGDAILPPAKRILLGELARKIPLTFVSGRSLAGLADMVPVAGAGYIGNHGLEILCLGRDWVHPRAQRIEPELKVFLKRLATRARGLDGVRVEDKGLSGSVHYRCAPRGVARELRELVHGEIGAHARVLRLAPGKKVLDILPRVRWDKGRAVAKYVSCLGGRRTFTKIYIGDDRTDEDAFARLGPRDIGIAVGNRRKTCAEFRRRDVRGVWKLLAAMNCRL